MTDPSPTAVRTFDFRTAGGSFASVQRRTLFLILGVEIFLGGSAVALAINAYDVALAKGIYSVDAEGLLSVLGIVCLGLAVLAPGTNRFFAGATDIEVSDEGITLRYPKGRSDSFQWSDPKRRLLLYDYSAHPQMVQQGRAYSLIVPWGRLSILTQESFQSVMEKARQQGAQITSYKGSAARYGFSPVIYRVQGGTI